MTAAIQSNTLKTFLALSVFALLALQGEAQAVPISILNPGFEAGPATNSPPTDWVPTGTAVAAEIQFDAAPFGNWSMAVAPGGQARQTTDHIISASDKYTLSFQSAATALVGSDISAVFWADNLGVLTELAVVPIGIDPVIKNWQPYQATFDFPAAGVVGQKLAIGFRNTSTGWSGVDQVSLDVVTGVPPVPPGPGGLPFFEDFNSFTVPNPANFNGGQFQSNLVVAHTGDVTGWSKTGGGTVHAVDHANTFPSPGNPQDFAPMFWQDNVITQASAIAANDSGQTYSVDFDASPAVYQAPSQVTTATDGLLIEVLRFDNTVLASHTHLPGAWAGNIAFVADSFEYIGDGSGDVRIRIGPAVIGGGTFKGAIDNLSVTAVPEPSSLVLISLAIVGLGLIARRRNRDK